LFSPKKERLRGNLIFISTYLMHNYTEERLRLFSEHKKLWREVAAKEV